MDVILSKMSEIFTNVIEVFTIILTRFRSESRLRHESVENDENGETYFPRRWFGEFSDDLETLP